MDTGIQHGHPGDGVRPRRERRVVRRLVGVVVLTAAFGLVEFGLWFAGVESQLEREDPFRGFSDLVSVFERDGDVYRTTPRATRTTFNAQQFLVDKPAQGLRLFSLGGSSAYGFPWGSDVAFTAILGEHLARALPERHVEAVNAAGVSYAMHRLDILSRELLRYEPDVLIVSSGHNEFVEAAAYAELAGPGVVRSRLAHTLARSRLYAGLRGLVASDGDERDATPEGLEYEVRREQDRVVGAAERAQIVSRFRSGLEAVVERARAAGVRVVLATVPCNLSEWAPESSSSVADLDDATRLAWSAAYDRGLSALVPAGHPGAEDPQVTTAAYDALRRCCELAPDHADSWFHLGRAARALGHSDEARLAFDRACDVDASPIRRTSQINEAVRELAGERAGDSDVLFVDVDRAFREASEQGLVGFGLIEDYVHPSREGHGLTAWLLADAIAQAGWFAPADAADRAAFDHLVRSRSIEVPERNAAWFFNQGVVLRMQGRVAEALDAFVQALQIRPDYVAAAINLAPLLADGGRVAEAVALLERAHQQDAASVGVRNALCAFLPAVGRHDEALEHGEEALRLRPGQAAVHVNVARALQGLGRHDEALAHFDEALELAPDDASARNNRAVLLIVMGRHDDALEGFARALQLRPDYASARRNRALLLAQLGRPADALSDLDRLVAQRPDDADAWYQRGNIHGLLGEHDLAVADCSRAIDLDPDHARAWFSRGLAHDLSGHSAQAAADLARAQQLDPTLR